MKKFPVEVFCYFWNWPYRRLRMILIANFLEKRNPDKNRGSLPASNLLFYLKKLTYCANVFQLMNLSIIHHKFIH